MIRCGCRGYHAYEAKYRSAPVPGDLSHAQAFHDTVLELLAGDDPVILY